MRFSPPLLALLLAACGSDDGPASAADARDDAMAAAGFDASLAEDPCSVLTPAIAAAALELREDQIEINEASRQVLPSACSYDEIDGEARATVNVAGVSESAADAAASFSQMYRALTDAEAAQAQADMDAALTGMADDGDVDADVAEAAQGATGGLARMAQQAGYEAVEGVGDQAVVSTFRGQFNSVEVRVGNLIYTASVSLPPPADDPMAMGQNRAPSLELARAIAAGL